MRVQVRKKITTTNSWATAANAITLADAGDIEVTRAVGKKKDTFNFGVLNANNKYFETFYDGDGATTAFTLDFGPLPSQHVDGTEQKCFVYVGGVLQIYTTEYTISGSTLTFVGAPTTGIGNIKVEYPVIEADDLIRIYRIKNTDTFTDSDIIDEGIISSINGTFNFNRRSLSVRGESFMSQLFNGLVFTKPGVSLNNSHDFIQDVIGQLNEFNQDRTIYGQDSTEWTNIGNDTTSVQVNYTMSYKSAIEVIDDLSSDKHTGNGQYIYYIVYNATDDRYEFNWKAKPTSSSDTIVEGTDAITEVKPKKDTEDVVNAAIYNAGFDCEGNGMEFPYFDWTSGAGSGSKWEYITSTNTIGEALINNEFTNNSGNWATQSQTSGVLVRTASYPTSYAGPYSMQFDTRSAVGVPSGTVATAGTDTAFNNNIWDEAQWQGWFAAKKVIDQKNKPRYKITVTMDYGSDANTYALGDIYTVTVGSFGISGKKLRLTEIEYSVDETRLNLEEDEVTLGS
jgi:hypothetical protein